MFVRRYALAVIAAGLGFAAMLLTVAFLANFNPIAAATQRPNAAVLTPTPFQPVVVFLTPLAPAAEPTLEPQPSPVPPTPEPTATVAAQPTPEQPVAPTTAPEPGAPLPIQPNVMLSGITHEAQGWNNCGPTTLKMNLQFYGRSDTQREIAAFTKPDSDDKNVSPSDLAAYVEKIGMRALIRENGAFEQLQQLLSNGLPVIVETGFEKPSGDDDWMGHYKLLIGYDDAEFTFMDSYNGPDQKIAYAEMDADWRAFNRLYIVVYPEDKDAVVRAIVGGNLDDPTMYANSAARARAEIEANPNDAFGYFNLGASLNGLQQYEAAAEAFDRAAQIGLPWRMMWYQFGPYVAYLQMGRYDDVIALANATLRIVNGLEESHYYKGLALQGLGRDDDARREFEAALRYNSNYLPAQSALQPPAN